MKIVNEEQQNNNKLLKNSSYIELRLSSWDLED